MPQVYTFLGDDTYMAMINIARDEKTTVSRLLRGLAEQKTGTNKRRGKL